MKSLICLILSLFLGMLIAPNKNVLSQGVSINKTGDAADNSAMLDVKSTDGGILIPRMTQAQRDLILNPAIGLLIYQTDDVAGFYYNSGTPETPVWSSFGSTGGWSLSGNNLSGSERFGSVNNQPVKVYSNSAERMRITENGNIGIGTDDPSCKLDIRGSTSDDGVALRIGNSDESHWLMFYGGRQNDPNPFIWWKHGDPLRFTTDQDGWSEKMRITSTGQLGIGTQTPDNSAVVDMTSTTRGLLPPRMTQAQRSAVTSPAAGLLVYQTDGTPGFYYYTGTNWVGLEGAGPGAISSAVCIDYDGNAYPTITIGTQTWMAENLRVIHYRNGDAIPNVTDDIAWLNLTTGAYCWHGNNQSTNAKYGALYNWFAIDDSRGLCPAGWHEPTDAEWTTFTSYLGGEPVAGGKMKSVSALWNPSNPDATNNSGFSGLPGGYRSGYGGDFYGVGNDGIWWSSTEDINYGVWIRALGYYYPEVYRYYTDKENGHSVRCLRDN